MIQHLSTAIASTLSWRLQVQNSTLKGRLSSLQTASHKSAQISQDHVQQDSNSASLRNTLEDIFSPASARKKVLKEKDVARNIFLATS